MKKNTLVVALLTLLIITGCTSKQAANSDKEFGSNSIMNHLTVNGVKMSEINTIQDVIDKLGGRLEIAVVCYEGEDGCPTYKYREFVTDEVSKKGIDTVQFGLYDENNNYMMEFWVHYKLYEKQKNDTPYFSISSPEAVVKLDDKELQDYTYEEISKKYDVQQGIGNTTYKIEFNSKDGDKYQFTGYYDSNWFEVFNYSQRDRGL